MNKMNKLALTMVTSLLLINQAYAWDQVCIHMKVGIGFVGWTQVSFDGDPSIGDVTTLTGQSKPVGGESCVALYDDGPDYRRIPAGKELRVSICGVADIWTGSSNCIQCHSPNKIIQNDSGGKEEFDGWGPMWNKQCEGPE